MTAVESVQVGQSDPGEGVQVGQSDAGISSEEAARLLGIDLTTPLDPATYMEDGDGVATRHALGRRVDVDPAELVEVLVPRTDHRPYQFCPSLSSEEFAALRASIAAEGVLTPILVDEAGAVIDGHHRQMIAAELGIDCPARVVTGKTDEQKRTAALVANTARRHMSTFQRREVVAASIEADPGLSDREHARRCGCSPSTVGSVRRQLSKLDTWDDPAKAATLQALADKAEKSARKAASAAHTAEQDVRALLGALKDAHEDYPGKQVMPIARAFVKAAESLGFAVHAIDCSAYITRRDKLDDFLAAEWYRSTE